MTEPKKSIVWAGPIPDEPGPLTPAVGFTVPIGKPDPITVMPINLHLSDEHYARVREVAKQRGYREGQTVFVMAANKVPDGTIVEFADLVITIK